MADWLDKKGVVMLNDLLSRTTVHFLIICFDFLY